MDEIKFINKNNVISNKYLNIENINWKKIKKQKIFAVLIDLKTINKEKIKYNLKKLLKLKNRTIRKKYNLGINGIIFYILNYEENNKLYENIIYAIKAISKENYKKMYTYIYDKVCDYLDSEFYGKNLCDFKNNKCGEKINTKSEIGCCRHYKNKMFGPLLISNKFVQCEYLKNHRCCIKCLPCKLFTCDYLEKKGIKFKIKEIFLLDTFFNPLQKLTLKTCVYMQEEKIIKRLLNRRIIKYF